MKTPPIAILDYGMGNLFSVRQACRFAGLEADVTCDKGKIMRAGALIVPGVGAFGDAMAVLERGELCAVIADFIKSGKPFMGICLGFQILFSESEEFGLQKGLGIFPGRVVKFSRPGKALKVPQVGWNSIYSARGATGWNGTELSGVSDGEFMYFVHSFYVQPLLQECVLATSTYEGIGFCSAFKKDNVFACQFHPEKSAGAGMAIYRNFQKIIERA